MCDSGSPWCALEETLTAFAIPLRSSIRVAFAFAERNAFLVGHGRRRGHSIADCATNITIFCQPGRLDLTSFSVSLPPPPSLSLSCFSSAFLAPRMEALKRTYSSLCIPMMFHRQLSVLPGPVRLAEPRRHANKKSVVHVLALPGTVRRSPHQPTHRRKEKKRARDRKQSWGPHRDKLWLLDLKDREKETRTRIRL